MLSSTKFASNLESLSTNKNRKSYKTKAGRKSKPEREREGKNGWEEGKLCKKVYFICTLVLQG